MVITCGTALLKLYINSKILKSVRYTKKIVLWSFKKIEWLESLGVFFVVDLVLFPINFIKENSRVVDSHSDPAQTGLDFSAFEAWMYMRSMFYK